LVERSYGNFFTVQSNIDHIYTMGFGNYII
jgi:hypothetical protein